MANQDFQSFLDEVVMKNDIVEIISGFTTLKRSAVCLARQADFSLLRLRRGRQRNSVR